MPPVRATARHLTLTARLLRITPEDYPEQANKRFRETLSFTSYDFEAMRRAYDDLRRTPSRPALLAYIKEICEKTGSGD
jgi:hypothetical protein